MNSNDPSLRERRGVCLASAFVSMALLFGLSSDAKGREPLKVTIQAGLEGDETTARVYLEANEAFVRKTLPEAVRKCATEDSSQPVVPFDLIVTVAKGGKIASVKADPTNKLTSCISRELEPTTLTEPPEDPTDVYVEVSIAP